MLKKLFILAAVAMLFLGVQAGTACADYAIVVNGDFGTGDFTGWTISDPTNTFAYVLQVAPQNYVPGGPSNYEAQLGTNALGNTPGVAESISQTINTIAGHSYTVNFWLANDDPSGTSYFNALWGGKTETLTLLTSNGATPNTTLSNAFDYNEFQFTDVATAATTTLAFTFLNDNGAYHLSDVGTPIPAAAWLLGSGLLGLIGLKRKCVG